MTKDPFLPMPSKTFGHILLLLFHRGDQAYNTLRGTFQISTSRLQPWSLSHCPRKIYRVHTHRPEVEFLIFGRGNIISRKIGILKYTNSQPELVGRLLALTSANSLFRLDSSQLSRYRSRSSAISMWSWKLLAMHCIIVSLTRFRQKGIHIHNILKLR